MGDLIDNLSLYYGGDKDEDDYDDDDDDDDDASGLCGAASSIVPRMAAISGY